jgi:hypothetical protein
MQQTFLRTLRTYPKRKSRASAKRRQGVICLGGIQITDGETEALMGLRAAAQALQ